MKSRIAVTLAGVAFGGAFYLLLIDTRYSPELYVLCVVATLAGLILEASREQGFAPATIAIAWFARAWRPVANVPRHVALLCRDAIAQLLTYKRSRGSFRAVAYDAGGGASGRGRVALSESLGSFAPNTIVLGVDPETNLLLVHQLHREGGADEIDVLGLG